jgi:excisionase family DNA binding protein
MQLMSIEDLAAYLGDSKRTIYKYIASGDCPPYIRISAKNIKFDRADVDAWLESKKVVPESAGEYWPRGSLPWTPRAKRVMKAAEELASQYKLVYVGNEHFLLGILEVKDCLAARILNNLGVDPVKVRRLYEHLSNDGKMQSKHEGCGDKSNLTDDAHKAIRCASEQAVRWGQEYIGAEHLLIGILLVGNGLGHRILTELGITLDKVQEETAKLIVCRTVQEK